MTLATAEAQASFKMVEAAEEYTKNEKAMELRWMNLLYEAAVTGKSTIIMVPANMPLAGFTNAFAVKGVQKLVADNKKENE